MFISFGALEHITYGTVDALCEDMINANYNVRDLVG
jgi:hypothetical protein